jgi:hypothetical protein
MHIEIVRTLSNATGTYGAMLIDGAPFAATVEQPWNGNAPGHSCIPIGDYRLLPYDSAAHGRTVVFHNPALGIFGTPAMIPPGLPGRSLCEIHSANWPFQLEGCVAVGERLADLPPHGLGITASAATLAKLFARWGDRAGLTATIRD